MNRLDELHEKLVNGALTEEEAAEFRRLLREPENRARIRRDMFVTAGLHEAVSLRAWEQRLAAASARAARNIVRFPVARRRLAAAAAIALLAAGWHWWPAPVATLREVRGVVEIQRGARTIPGRDGLRLAAGDRVRTRADGGVTIRWPAETTAIELASASTLVLTALEHGKHLALEAGSLTADVQKQPPGQPMQLVTPNAQCEVLGTRFSLSTAPDQTSLRVERGEVLLAPGGETTGELVASRQTGQVGPDGRVRVEPLPVEETLASALLAAWPLDGSLAGRTDVEARSIAEPLYEEGRAGLALHFPRGDAGRRTLITSMVQLPAEWTLSLWVKVSADATGLMTLAANSASGVNTDGFRFTINHLEMQDSKQTTINDWSLRVRIGNGRFSLTAPTKPGVLPPGAWHHVALTVRTPAGEARIYVDGREATIRRRMFTELACPGPLLLGGMAGAYPTPLRGDLDEPAVYGRALTPAEIRHLASALPPR